MVKFYADLVIFQRMSSLSYFIEQIMDLSVFDTFFKLMHILFMEQLSDMQFIDNFLQIVELKFLANTITASNS